IMSIHFFGWETHTERRRLLKPGQHPRTGHRYTMFHGTHKSNAEAIVTSGFRPSSGGTLGAGVYCSRNIMKAMNYPVACSSNDRVVFQLRVRVGKVKKIDQHNFNMATTWHQQGYDTAWLPPTVAGLEEDCVWDPDRLVVVGIAHCTDTSFRKKLEELIRAQPKAKLDEGTSSQNKCIACGWPVCDHETIQCWGCKKTICPFLVKHKCKEKSEIKPN
uniref:Uncharacterized LOC114657953 n=2 Tax=Erpetoichthys calabaricus TaxID=27687 RepID=A0A8C4S3M0_ERPCA